MPKHGREEYQPVQQHNYRERSNAAPGTPSGLTLQDLDKDWSEVMNRHLFGSTQPDGLRYKRFEGDTIDGRGKFHRNEVREMLKTHSRDELENILGVSPHKIDIILKRADRDGNGEIDYRYFLEVVQAYRLNSEQESKVKAFVRIFAYAEEFSCQPPTLVMIFITLAELACFIYTSWFLERDYHQPLGWSGPVPYCSPLIYNPRRRFEAWRYVSYMLVHIGLQHFIFNMIMQIIVGVFLEMSQEGFLGSLKVLVVYISGVLAGSLGTSLADPNTYIAGASGGVYSLIAAHLATLIINWQEDSSVKIRKVVHKPLTRIVRLVFISLLAIHDIAFAIYARFYDPDNRTGFVGHLCGSIAGLMVGIILLDNRRVRSWEKWVKWICVVLFMAILAFCIIWNIYANEWSPGFYPTSDVDLYEDYGGCRNFEFF